MATLAEYKQKYPEYADTPDEELADALYQQQGGSGSREEFNQKVGLTPGQVEPEGAFAPSADAPSGGGAITPAEVAPETEDAFAPREATKLETYKAENPQVAEIPDAELAPSLYAQQGGGKTEADFYAEIGYEPTVAESVEVRKRQATREADAFKVSQENEFYQQIDALPPEEREDAIKQKKAMQVRQEEIAATEPLEDQGVGPLTPFLGVSLGATLGARAGIGLAGKAIGALTGAAVELATEVPVSYVTDAVQQGLKGEHWALQLAGTMGSAVLAGGISEKALRGMGKNFKVAADAFNALPTDAAPEVVETAKEALIKASKEAPLSARRAAKKAYKESQAAGVDVSDEAALSKLVTDRKPGQVGSKTLEQTKAQVTGIAERAVEVGRLDEIPDVPVVAKVETPGPKLAPPDSTNRGPGRGGMTPDGAKQAVGAPPAKTPEVEIEVVPPGQGYPDKPASKKKPIAKTPLVSPSTGEGLIVGEDIATLLDPVRMGTTEVDTLSAASKSVKLAGKAADEVVETLTETRVKSAKGSRDVLTISKHLPMETVGGAIGGLANGVDWDEYERTGNISYDPVQGLRGMVIGAGLVSGVKLSGKALGALNTQATKMGEAYTALVDAKFGGADPLRTLANNQITNEWWRKMLNLNAFPETFQAQLRLREQTSQVMEMTKNIAGSIAEAAPTTAKRKRLLQVMGGGTTSDPTLAKKAQELNGMFEALRTATRENNLLHYSMFDGLTKKERTNLRTIINDPQAAQNDVLVAQSMLDDHYHVFSAGYRYVPVTAEKKLRAADAKAINREIRALKKKSRKNNPKGDDEIEEVIYQLEDVLKPKAKGVVGGSLDRRYAIRRGERPGQGVKDDSVSPDYVPARLLNAQVLSEETRATLEGLTFEAHSIAESARKQSTDVFKSKFFKTIIEEDGAVKPKDFEGEVPSGWVKLGENVRKGEWDYGELNGRVVRQDVYNAMTEAQQFRTTAEATMDKVWAPWKSHVVVWNPASHARNFGSGYFFSYLGGVQPGKGRYREAMNAMRLGRRSPLYAEAETAGLFSSTYVNTEIQGMFEDLRKIEGKEKGSVAADAMKRWIGKAVGLPGRAYNGNDQMFKLALFKKARDDGKSLAEAKRHAEKYMFNYQDIPPAVQHIKRWGVPFMTFAYKANIAVAESAIRKPWKLGLLAGAVVGASAYSAEKMGTDIETISKERAVVGFDDTIQGDFVRESMPGGKYVRNMGQVLLPMPDEYGNRQYWNVGPYMPWEVLGQGVFPDHPMLTMFSNLTQNKDSFTGRELYTEGWADTWEMAAGMIKNGYDKVTNPLMPGRSGSKRLAKAWDNYATGEKSQDWIGTPETMFNAAMRTLLGVQLQSVDPVQYEKGLNIVAGKMRRAASKKLRGLSRRAEEEGWSREKLNAEYEAVQTRLQELQETDVRKRLK